MKNKLNWILTLTILFSSVPVCAQGVFKNRAKLTEPSKNNDEVVLVVSGDGETKEEATKAALLSAIEQTYGTFVSANTEILDDELVKNEIVTISKGNIKHYKELSLITLPSGLKEVAIQATVSISSLVSYAKSKGAVAEFAGATFGMNMQIFELNKKNELLALEHLSRQLSILIPTWWERVLSVGEPFLATGDSDLLYFANLWGKGYAEPQLYYYNAEKVDESSEMALRTIKEVIERLQHLDDCYILPLSISYRKSNSTDSIIELIKSTLIGLSLSEDEARALSNNNKVPLTKLIFDSRFPYDPAGPSISVRDLNELPDYTVSSVRGQIRVNLRNSVVDVINALYPFMRDLWVYSNMISILDNLGQSSEVTFDAPIIPLGGDIDSSDRYLFCGTGLFEPFCVISDGYRTWRSCHEIRPRGSDSPDSWTIYPTVLTGTIYVFIPKNEIMRYSQFQLN